MNKQRIERLAKTAVLNSTTPMSYSDASSVGGDDLWVIRFQRRPGGIEEIVIVISELTTDEVCIAQIKKALASGSRLADIA